MAIGDIRVRVDWLRHPKTVRLRREHGPDAVLSLLQLWMYAACNRPSGVLKEMTEAEIEIAADWAGEKGKLVGALTSLKFLVKRGQWLKIKSWEKYQRYVIFAPKRSAQARFASNARWKGKEGKNGSNAKAYSGQAVEIYKAYPLQKDRYKALAAIEEALQRPNMTADLLLKLTQEYARAVSHWTNDTRKYVPTPAKWFGDGRYADDPKTWFSNAPRGRDPGTWSNASGGREVDEDLIEGKDL